MLRKLFHLRYFLFFITCFFYLFSFSQSLTENSTDLSLKQKRNFSRLIITVDGGIGRLIGDVKSAEYFLTAFGITSEQSERYYSDYKSGWQAGASMYYFVTPNWGIGVDYNFFTTGSSFMGYIEEREYLNKFYGKFSETIYTNFAGLSVLRNQRLGARWNLFGKFTQGKCFYRNEVQTIILPELYTADAKAYKLEAGTAYQLNPHISIALSAAYFRAFLFNVDKNDGTSTTTIDLRESGVEDLGRFNLSAGIQIYF
jgi:hypothetical protein